MALTLNTREAGEFGGAHEWLGSLSVLCWIFPGAEKEHEENKYQVLAPEKILTVRVLEGKAADILQVFFPFHVSYWPVIMSVESGVNIILIKFSQCDLNSLSASPT